MRLLRKNGIYNIQQHTKHTNTVCAASDGGMEKIYGREKEDKS